MRRHKYLHTQTDKTAMEEWKQIGQSKYEVSNLGNVRNSIRMNVLKPRSNPKRGGYICYEVYLDIDGNGQKHYKIHRLVALAFIPNLENRTEIDHIDRNTANNAVSNLRWATRSETSNQLTRPVSDNKLGESEHPLLAKTSPSHIT
jgi:hypothetical protein